MRGEKNRQLSRGEYFGGGFLFTSLFLWVFLERIFVEYWHLLLLVLCCLLIKRRLALDFLPINTPTIIGSSQGKSTLHVFVYLVWNPIGYLGYDSTLIRIYKVHCKIIIFMRSASGNLIKFALVEFNTEPDINCNLFSATFSVQLFSIILFFIQIKTDRVSWYRYKSFTCLYSKQLDTGSYISLHLIEI